MDRRRSSGEGLSQAADLRGDVGQHGRGQGQKGERQPRQRPHPESFLLGPGTGSPGGDGPAHQDRYERSQDEQEVVGGRAWKVLRSTLEPRDGASRGELAVGKETERSAEPEHTSRDLEARTHSGEQHPGGHVGEN